MSGGQTGVDRGALDAALAIGFPCGGWCPAGRKAEDGPIPLRYPVQELAGAGYLKRTRRNVEDSDGTLILTSGPASGGTLRTVEFSQRLHKPLLVIDAAITSSEQAARAALDFMQGQHVRRLNVAGPRLSGWEGGYLYALETLAKVIVECRRGEAGEREGVHPL